MQVSVSSLIITCDVFCLTIVFYRLVVGQSDCFFHGHEAQEIAATIQVDEAEIQFRDEMWQFCWRVTARTAYPLSDTSIVLFNKDPSSPVTGIIQRRIVQSTINQDCFMDFFLSVKDAYQNLEFRRASLVQISRLFSCFLYQMVTIFGF
jgi:hypothetical protein